MSTDERNSVNRTNERTRSLAECIVHLCTEAMHEIDNSCVLDERGNETGPCATFSEQRSRFYPILALAEKIKREAFEIE